MGKSAVGLGTQGTGRDTLQPRHSHGCHPRRGSGGDHSAVNVQPVSQPDILVRCSFGATFRSLSPQSGRGWFVKHSARPQRGHDSFYERGFCAAEFVAHTSNKPAQSLLGDIIALLCARTGRPGKRAALFSVFSFFLFLRTGVSRKCNSPAYPNNGGNMRLTRYELNKPRGARCLCAICYTRIYHRGRRKMS